ncbi:hypothetical protein PVK06_010598 [Gossypium arboreum]|uniref:RNase H type-1 domain-containing protein n=1 Tax=Gossypium arboreum TaxID=29729 RepID=A0ABR0Q7F8_GOSAR|nr:hypothetical protein PVK06_010598 [Gossypium arboreum]
MTLVRRIKEVSRHFESVKFQFVNREGNMVADRTCPSTHVNLHILDAPTFHIRKLLFEDKFDIPYVKIN